MADPITTVADVIAMLQKLDPTLPVYSYHAGSGDYERYSYEPTPATLYGTSGDDFTIRHHGDKPLPESEPNFKAVVI